MKRFYAEGALRYEKIDELPEDKQFTCRLYCSECHTLVNETKPLTKKELQDHWVMLVMGSGFATGPCFHCYATTFSDLNIHTELNIFLFDNQEDWQKRQDSMTEGNAKMKEHYRA